MQGPIGESFQRQGLCHSRWPTCCPTIEQMSENGTGRYSNQFRYDNCLPHLLTPPGAFEGGQGFVSGKPGYPVELPLGPMAFSVLRQDGDGRGRRTIAPQCSLTWDESSTAPVPAGQAIRNRLAASAPPPESANNVIGRRAMATTQGTTLTDSIRIQGARTSRGRLARLDRSPACGASPAQRG